MEHLEFNLLYRWFVGLNPDDRVRDASVFAKNRDRLLEAEIAHTLLARIVNHRKLKRLLSKEHFSVDGTLHRGLGLTGRVFSRVTTAILMGMMIQMRVRDQAATRVVIANATFTMKSAAMPRMSARPTGKRDCCCKGKGKESKLSYMGHALISKTAMDWL